MAMHTIQLHTTAGSTMSLGLYYKPNGDQVRLPTEVWLNGHSYVPAEEDTSEQQRVYVYAQGQECERCGGQELPSDLVDVTDMTTLFEQVCGECAHRLENNPH